MIFLSQSKKKTRDKDNTKFRVKSYKSWTRDPVPSHRSQTRSLAFFFSYKSCIPNQPLIRKINLLKGSVTPRGIFCGRSGRWKKKKRRETEWYSLGLRDFECFFPRAPVSPGSTRSPQSFHGSVARCVCSGTFVFSRYLDPRGVYLARGTCLSTFNWSRSRTSSLLSDLLCF